MTFDTGPENRAQANGERVVEADANRTLIGRHFSLYDYCLNVYCTGHP